MYLTVIANLHKCIIMKNKPKTGKNTFKKEIIIFSVIILIAIIIVLAHSTLKNEKYCEKDDDCVGVYRGCCYSCSGYDDVLNKEAAAALELRKEAECRNVPCPMYKCLQPIFNKIPVCESNRCELDEELNCHLIYSMIQNTKNITYVIEWLDQRLLAEEADVTAQEAIIFCNCPVKLVPA